jgi:hypothetical protein
MAKRKKKTGKSRSVTSAAFGEIQQNPPAILEHTRRKFGPARAEAQRVAIGLSKARAAGASLPRGPVTRDGARRMSTDQLKRGLKRGTRYAH